MIHRTRAAAIRERKGQPFATITAYDAAFGRAAEAAGIDVILVGDSLGNVVLGYEST
jgi:3-methyl-2-oxobutanoate hydroxymethyltransferase